MKTNPFLLTDYYKVGHVFQYPDKTELVYSNLTPRKSRIDGVDEMVFFGLQYFMPLISLILIYFWVLFLPEIYPLWFLFVIGIIEDSLTGIPLGISSFSNILFRFMIISQKRFIVKESREVLSFVSWAIVPVLKRRSAPIVIRIK